MSRRRKGTTAQAGPEAAGKEEQRAESPPPQKSPEELQHEIGALAAALAAKTAEADEAKRERPYLLAEIDNTRKWAEKERERAAVSGAEGVAAALLGVMDSFEKAAAQARALAGGAGEAAQFAAGVDLLYRSFAGALANAGLSPIECVGKAFDPYTMEAVMSVPDDSRPEGTVIEEVQRGYLFRGKVLRTSKVRVASSQNREGA